MGRLLVFLASTLFVFVSVLFTGTPDSEAQQMTGTVTLVGNNVVVIVDQAGIKHRLSVTQAQEEILTTGYNVSFQAQAGKLVSFTQLGVANNVQDLVYSQSNLPRTGVEVLLPPKTQPEPKPQSK